MTSTALLVLAPRDIPYCVEAIAGLDVPKCWLRYMPEPQVVRKGNQEIAATDFDRYVVIADDCEPTQEALDLVLALHDEGHPVVTGYSNFDGKLPFVNLCWNKLSPPPPGLYSYGFYDLASVRAMGPGPVVTTFAGMSLTCMSREMWLRFPLMVCDTGGQCDYHMSYRLQEAGVQIVAPPQAFVLHHKDEYGVYPDRAPEKQLLIGQRPAAVEWTDLDKRRG